MIAKFHAQCESQGRSLNLFLTARHSAAKSARAMPSSLPNVQNTRLDLTFLLFWSASKERRSMTSIQEKITKPKLGLLERNRLVYPL